MNKDETRPLAEHTALYFPRFFDACFENQEGHQVLKDHVPSIPRDRNSLVKQVQNW